ncbi:MAG TPA: hypothetical protein P5123_07170 [Spirochaetota bacterium]|nr:hypothetical protein [Spirochaetota bacterium]
MINRKILSVLFLFLPVFFVNASCEIDDSVRDMNGTEHEFEGRLWKIERYEYKDGSEFFYPVDEAGIEVYHYHSYADGIFRQYESYHYPDGEIFNFYNSRIYAEYEKVGEEYWFSNGEKWNCAVEDDLAICVCSETPDISVIAIVYERSSLTAEDFNSKKSLRTADLSFQ